MANLREVHASVYDASWIEFMLEWPNVRLHTFYAKDMDVFSALRLKASHADWKASPCSDDEGYDTLICAQYENKKNTNAQPVAVAVR